jgi:hypothetical protein
MEVEIWVYPVIVFYLMSFFFIIYGRLPSLLSSLPPSQLKRIPRANGSMSCFGFLEGAGGFADSNTFDGDSQISKNG